MAIKALQWSRSRSYRISIIGHSEGSVIAPRVAMDHPMKIKNIILMGTVAQNMDRDILQYQAVSLPSEKRIHRYWTKIILE